jgi:hypothetical protein
VISVMTLVTVTDRERERLVLNLPAMFPVGSGRPQELFLNSSEALALGSGQAALTAGMEGSRTQRK